MGDRERDGGRRGTERTKETATATEAQSDSFVFIEAILGILKQVTGTVPGRGSL